MIAHPTNSVGYLAMKANQRQGKLVVRHLKVEDCIPNTWNPNVMDDRTFNRLVEEIRAVGFIDPIQVVPLEGGKYQIIGGEHRWRAAQQAGLSTIPAVILTDNKWQEEDLRKFVTLRLNVIRGKINPEKFARLYEELSEKYSDEELQHLMGFTDEDAFNKLVRHVSDALKSAGLPSEITENFDEAKKRVKTVDDLAIILNKIFAEYGDTLDRNFMWFSYGGQKHLYIICDKPLWKLVEEFMADVDEHNADASVEFANLLMNWKNSRQKH